MAVFTPVEPDALATWLASYDVGTVREFRGIPSGIENSNFFLTTTAGAFVLTIFERLRAYELPFYLELMRHLADRGLPCPRPLATRAGALQCPLYGKPAALVTRLEGASLTDPDATQCASVGATLARMHLAAHDFGAQQPNLRGLDWWRATVPLILPHLAADQRSLLADELEFQNLHLPQLLARLPQGPVHADLFRDNVLFKDGQLCGLIDFYFAGCDTWLFDLAVAANDWCADPLSGAPVNDKARALYDSYAGLRPFGDEERTAWPIMQRAAALRFWVSRLADLHLPRQAQMLTPHDPARFELLLRQRRSGAAGLLAPLPGAR